MENFDIESEIEDLEGILDFVGGISTSIKAHFKARFKSIRKNNILNKRNINRTKEIVTRYKLDKVKSIPVTGDLYDFLKNELVLAINIDIMNDLLKLTMDDFNLDVINILTTKDIPKSIYKLSKTNNKLDIIGKNILLSGIMDDKEFSDILKNKKYGFITSYIYGTKLKGLIVDIDRNILYNKTFVYKESINMPTLVPINTLKDIIEFFINNDEVTAKSALRMYKRVIKDIGKMLRNSDEYDALKSSDIRLISDSVMYHMDNIVNTVFETSSLQYNFIISALSELDGTTAYTGRTVL